MAQQKERKDGACSECAGALGKKGFFRKLLQSTDLSPNVISMSAESTLAQKVVATVFPEEVKVASTYSVGKKPPPKLPGEQRADLAGVVEFVVSITNLVIAITGLITVFVEARQKPTLENIRERLPALPDDPRLTSEKRDELIQEALRRMV